MNIIKKLVLACAFVLTLTASKCFVVSSFDSSDDDRDNEGLIIAVTNAEIANSEVMQSLNQTLILAEITSQSTQYVDEMYSSELLNIPCENDNGAMTINSNDNNRQKNISAEENIYLSYSNCDLQGSVVNGDLEISALESKGIDVGHFDSGTNWSKEFIAHADSLKITTHDDQIIVYGDINVTLQFDALSAELISKIDNKSIDLESKTRRKLHDINITQVINLAVSPTNYTFSIESLRLSSEKLNGYVQVTANSTIFTGDNISNPKEYFIDLHSPRDGMLYITGKNSNAEMLVIPGDQVTIGVDVDGDSLSEYEIYTTWQDLM